MITCPVSGVSNPQIIFNRVDFPVPFLATKAILSPLSIPKVTSSKSTLTPKDLDIFSMDT